MTTNWIERVMRMNATIVETETRHDAQVAVLVALARRGQDTTQAKPLLASYRHSLDLMRQMQTEPLQDTQAAE